ncbi:MAG: hypothetical protein RLZZ428_700 [Pseudomonadota bacterium]
MKKSVFGNIVKGYDQPVLNEREARAAAGLLFLFGFLSFMNSFMLSNLTMTQFFVTFFMIDFTIRITTPEYAPSLLIGRVFVQNQTPEYVGAAQKRFAWSIGLLLSLVMFYLTVIEPQMNPIKILICSVCLVLLFSESAFSICLGCKVYNILKKEQARYCPGGVCEIKEKEPIQRFTFVQSLIVIVVSIAVVLGLLVLWMSTPSKSAAMQMMPAMLKNLGL